MTIFKKFISLSIVIATPFIMISCDGNVEANTLAKHKDSLINTSKKGIGTSRYNKNSKASGDKLNNLNLGWYYNWGVEEPNPNYVDAEFVPMIWGAGSVNDSNLNKIKKGYEEGKYNYLLTFNEPDHKDQSNMTVQQAISLWPKLEALGIPLSSPCPAFYSSGWLDEFMQEAKRLNYRVDFIAVHCYQDFSVSGIENQMKRDILDVIYEKYQLPIWVTEYGAIDISSWAGDGKYNPNCTEKAAKKYIENCTKMLEKTGYVERYAWFLDNFNETGNSRPKEAKYTSLYNDDDTISSTGLIYKDIDSKTMLSIETKELPAISKNEQINFTLVAAGGTGDYSFSSSNLPLGLTLNTNGKILGKISNPGIYKIKFNVFDQGNQSTYKYLTLKVN